MSTDKIPNCKLDHAQTHTQQRYIKILHHHCYPEVPLLLHAPMHMCSTTLKSALKVLNDRNLNVPGTGSQVDPKHQQIIFNIIIISE